MRWLMMAVVVMGVLIVAGVVTIGMVLFQRMSPGAAAIAARCSTSPPARALPAPRWGPDRLAVQLQGGGPDRVVLVDTKAGRVLGRVSLAR